MDVTERMAQLDSQVLADHRDDLARQDIQESPVVSDHQDLKEESDSQVHKANEVHPDQWGLLVLKDRKVQKDSLVTLVLLETLEAPDHRVSRDQLEIKDWPALSGTSVHQVNVGFAVHPVSLAMRAKTDNLGQMHLMENLALLVMMDHRVQLVSRAHQEVRELWVNLEKRVTWVQSVFLDGWESWDFRVFLDNWGQMDLQDSKEIEEYRV